ncbi:MAG: 50S ribosomal protein L9 [candidate division KSB1 bacterium]|nr:50S ribosomal protein L9 [candidate division KSB1 bacterium]MDZ7345410.1 50S ribosomal protein L9 [candidate division KSB1 bacterium]
MKIILKSDIDKLGKAGDIVETKRGYARNYLIPKGYAVEATPANLKIIEQEKAAAMRRLQKEIDEAKKFAEQLENVSVTATVQVGEENRVFGAVTNQTIAELLAEKGIEIDRKKILLEEPIKQLGVFDVPIKLHSEVEAKIKVWVVRE